MTGDQTSVPADADVERDELGRVVSVGQTLSAASVGAAGESPKPSSAFGAELNPLCDELIEKNLALIQSYGVGLEDSFDFDQGTGELTLVFPNGRELMCEAEILGSFDPAQRTFLWAWANPSLTEEVTRTAQHIRRIGEGRGEAILTEGEQAIKFDVIGRLMAYGASVGELVGVYRAMSGHTSVFVAMKRISHAGDRFGADAPAAGDAAAAESLVDSFDSKMFALDARHNDGEREGVDAELLAQKIAVYDDHWRRDDDYWKPCSFGWPSDHDPGEYRVSFTAPDGAGGLVIGHAAGRYGTAKQVYRIGLFDDGPKITDQLIEWGSGFIWPEPVEEDRPQP
jgi:hypothetical protein